MKRHTLLTNVTMCAALVALWLSAAGAQNALAADRVVLIEHFMKGS